MFCLLALYHRDQLCVFLLSSGRLQYWHPGHSTGIRKIHTEVVAVWAYYDMSVRSGRASATHKWRPLWVVNVWFNRRSGGTDPCSDIGASSQKTIGEGFWIGPYEKCWKLADVLGSWHRSTIEKMSGFFGGLADVSSWYLAVLRAPDLKIPL